jgi:hypothetical protein
LAALRWLVRLVDLAVAADANGFGLLAEAP